MLSRDLREKERGYSLISNQSVIELVSELAVRYQLTSIRPLLEICKASRDRTGLSIAVLGRFKAGKSSFLNHLIGREVLPVGVIPVTSVVTDVGYGAQDAAIVRFADGREVGIPVQDLSIYVAEAENPLNRKHVEAVSVRLDALSRWPGLRFIDTPGLESAFAHNTEASIGWAPNVDVALIAIGVDPPLSEHDIALIKTLFRYTPRVAILLTKADILEEEQLGEVIDYVRGQLATRFEQYIPIYPYSTRPGFERLKRDVEDTLLKQVAMDVASQRRAISNRKITTLLRDCEQYIRLTLKSAEMLDTERVSLQKQLLAERESLADTRLEVQLVARHAAAGTRSAIERALAPCENSIRQKLRAEFEEQANHLPHSFARLLEAFSDWLHAALSSELLSVSGAKRSEFVQPLTNVQRQYQRALQNFRDRLSDRTLTLYGVPLKTTEPEIVPQPPKMPDVNIGRAFDHNWELLSPLLPMAVLRGAVFKRFQRKIADETFKNLSRLTGQWDEIVTSAIFELQREAEKRMEELLATVQGLVSASNDNAPQIRADFERLLAVAADASTDDDRIEHRRL
jgi:GTP-binding protein EngB required for normal cell division